MYQFFQKNELLYRADLTSGELWVVSPWYKYVRVQTPDEIDRFEKKISEVA